MFDHIPKNSKVAVGLSGGVDSSVGALLLKQAGFAVTGVHMQCWDYDAKGCTGKQDRADAVATASQLNIPFTSLDFQNEYSQKVMSYFFDEYQAGRTPNPDVLCNKEIKFGLFLKWALDEGFDYIATGHYARLTSEKGRFGLQIPKDVSKDQTYFLYSLSQEQLSRAIFPVGDFTKKEVRELAVKHSLVSATKPDSVGICFIGDIDVKAFLISRFRAVEQKGNVLDTNGNIIGIHNGAIFFTIGQRHGFEINVYKGVPMYVLSKNVDTNELVVGTYDECMRDAFKLSNIHYIKEEFFSELACEVRIRHLGKLYGCVFDAETMSVKLAESAFGVAPGQSAVFYKNGHVLGGGVIA